MKMRVTSRLLILILIGQIICQAQAPKSRKHTPNMKKAQALVASLVKTDYAQATKGFTAEMKGRVTVPKLKEIWETILMQAGPFGKQLSTESSKVEEEKQFYEVVIVKCQFERAAVNVRVVFDSSNHVAGLFFAAA